MDQNSFLAHCESLLRSKVGEFHRSRVRNRKSSLAATIIDALEDRVLLASDLGDAPAPYPVTIADDGARHTQVGPKLGLTADTEADGLNSINADSDGADEDGIVFGQVNAGRPDASVVVKVRNAAHGTKLDAWIDFNADGDWEDAGEQIFDSAQVLNNTDQTMTFAVPAGADLGTTFARFRISSVGGLNPTGDAPDGEVEDHKVTIGLASPVITAPAISAQVNVTGTNRVTLTWNATPQATGYEIWVRSHNYLAQSEFHRTTVTGTSYTPDVDFGAGKYTVWMRSLGDGNVKSTWTPTRQFFVVAKTTITPMVKLQNTSTPTITWSPVLGAESYRVWISNLTTGQSPLILQNGLTGTSFTPGSALPLATYRVWVAAVSANATAGWSLPVDFTTGPAPVLTPQTPTMLANKFSWTAVPGAVGYEFQLRNLSNGETILNSTISSTSWTPGTVLFSGVKYRWWVRAKSAQNVYSNWSPGSDFIAGGQTTVQTPVGATADTTPAFTWLSVAGATRYQVLVHRVDVVSSIINRNDILTNSFTPTTALAAGTYRVWVRAIASSGVLTTWSVPVTFTVSDAEQPPKNDEIPHLLASAIEMPFESTESQEAYDGSDDYEPSSDVTGESGPIDMIAPVKATSQKTRREFDSAQYGLAEIIDLAISEWVDQSADLG